MDTNKIIKIEELEIGDEILVPKNSQLRYAKVLQKPQLSKSTFKWNPNKQRYRGVKCSMRIKEEKETFGHINQYIRTIKSNPPDGDLQIIEQILNLNFKDIWLVKREGI